MTKRTIFAMQVAGVILGLFGPIAFAVSLVTLLLFALGAAIGAWSWVFGAPHLPAFRLRFLGTFEAPVGYAGARDLLDALVGPVWATVFSVGAVLLVGLFFLAIAVRRNDRRIAAYRAEEEARLQTEYAEIEAERRSAEEKRKAAKREKEQGEAEKLAEFWRQSEEQREAEEREANAKRLAEAEERAAAVRLAEFRRRPKLVIIVALAAAELAAVPVYLQWRGCA